MPKPAVNLRQVEQVEQDAAAAGIPLAYRDFRTGDPLDFYRLLADAVTESPPPPSDAGVLGLLDRIGIALSNKADEPPNYRHSIQVYALACVAPVPACVPDYGRG